MKNIIIGIAVFATTLSACNNSSDKSNEAKNKNSDSVITSSKTNQEPTKVTTSVKDIIDGYLQMKNALVNDNGSDAANAGKTIMTAVDKMDTSSLSDQQKKSFADVADDIKENAQHCSVNGNKIEHQREHFEMLTQDMYDLVKSAGAGQTLYYDHCPMYNNGKGANWISEIKEIKNPYLGKKMLTCGSVKEALK
ncbi:MAG: DUF3347 domain-containing protein [Chitinophagaceae bacterium]|nr:DUF3347 domain-containing protein [Chitinophagaceae bacterium]